MCTCWLVFYKFLMGDYGRKVLRVKVDCGNVRQSYVEGSYCNCSIVYGDSVNGFVTYTDKRT